MREATSEVSAPLEGACNLLIEESSQSTTEDFLKIFEALEDLH